MKLITSPAKLMNIKNKNQFLTPTTPHFIEKSAFIQSFLKEKSPDFLSNLMEISSKLAQENWQKNQEWNPTPSPEESTTALFAFTGEVYRGLDAKTLSPEAVAYLQENYRILSGLYGMLRPSDTIMPYRLEMGRPFAFDQFPNIYSFWQDIVNQWFNSQLEENEPILNLASTEYFKVLNKKKLKGKIINFDFQELKDGKLKTIVVYTKHARGLMVRYCAENQVKTIDEVKQFNLENYFIDEEKSTDEKLVFIR